MPVRYRLCGAAECPSCTASRPAKLAYKGNAKRPPAAAAVESKRNTNPIPNHEKGQEAISEISRGPVCLAVG